MENAIPSTNFRFIFTNDFKIGNFFRIKDRIPDKVCSNICYMFSCPNCNVRYVGCSSRSFHIRIMEHTGKSHRTGQKLHSPPFSAIRDHARDQDHQFNYESFKIIARLKTGSDAFIAERILIKNLKPELYRPS